MGLMKIFRKVVAPVVETAIGVVNPVAGVGSKILGDKVFGSPTDPGKSKVDYDPAAVTSATSAQLQASAPTTAANPTGELILAGLAGLGLILAFKGGKAGAK